MTEIKFCFSQDESAKQFMALPGSEAWGALQPGMGRFDAASPLARVHRYSGSDNPEPAFALTAAAEPAHTLCTVAPQADSTPSQTVYAVHDGSGRFIGRITHGRSPLGIRQAWRIEDAARQCSAVAYKGNIRGWVAYWAGSPFWVIMALVYLLNGDLHPSRSLWSKPHRARWRMRAGSGPRKAALDFQNGRYRADAGVPDVNLIYAQAVLYGA
ncbi:MULTISPECIES: hypothetical protein [unclassified Streptomyces]|uniref:hypothetical protein n=1 Tax=unclassified Streptomyces TaxID=2593676 RepID=UPI00131A10A8|nr:MULTISPECIES: hypothetical protein [unclassified Streptomyces]MYT29017.1 hypothetical protein [Streptomyces sp. SID8354]